MLDVLSACPRDIGVIVTEYLRWGSILKSSGSGENVAYLRRNFPQLIFLQESRSYCSPSQFVAPRVDGVWSVSSNVAYQALLYNRTLGSPPTSHFGRIADATTLPGFFESLGSSPPARNDGLMAWLLERYFVPEALLSDGRWLRDYFVRRIDALAESANPTDAFAPVADADRLIDSWIVKAPKSSAVRFAQPPDEAVSEARSARAMRGQPRKARCGFAVHELAHDSPAATPVGSRGCSLRAVGIDAPGEGRNEQQLSGQR